MPEIPSPGPEGELFDEATALRAAEAIEGDVKKLVGDQKALERLRAERGPEERQDNVESSGAPKLALETTESSSAPQSASELRDKITERGDIIDGRIAMIEEELEGK